MLFSFNWCIMADIVSSVRGRLAGRHLERDNEVESHSRDHLLLIVKSFPLGVVSRAQFHSSTADHIHHQLPLLSLSDNLSRTLH